MIKDNKNKSNADKFMIKGVRTIKFVNENNEVVFQTNSYEELIKNSKEIPPYTFKIKNRRQK